MSDTKTKPGINLATLIGSRICHDLISPVGAITNGLELLELSGAASGPELDLIGDSVGNAGARIRFFRIAYGSAGDQMIGQPEIAALFRDLNKGARIQVSWHPDIAQSRSDVRLAFLALQCCETALPYGGSVDITEGDGIWTVTGTGTKIAADDPVWTALERGDMPDLTPAMVQFGLLRELSAEARRTVFVSRNEEQIQIRF